jgi:flavin-dependent dehydrogenase
MTNRLPDYDVVVAGGGPAGATTATILAQHGRRVLVLERETFPRYHVGESLIPYTWFPLERLGVIGRLKASANPKKHSVQFVSVEGRASHPFYFHQTIEHECAQTWQVLRSEFDAMLLDNARDTGVEVRHGVAARDLVWEDGRAAGFVVDTGGGRREEIRARAVVDATGRDTLLAGRLGWKRRDPELNKIAVWSYFQGGVRDPGLDEGATTVAYIREKGWFWYIPLPDDMVSVGVVAEPAYLYRDHRDPQAILDREIAASPWIREHVAPACQAQPVRVTGEFSYRAERIGGDGFCLVGDAFSFLDPIFSSGVFLALAGGELAADAIHTALDEGGVTAARLERYAGPQQRALEDFRRLVLAFYAPGFSFREFLRAYPHLHPLLVDTLVGNVFKDLGPLAEAIETFLARPAGATGDVTV